MSQYFSLELSVDDIHKEDGDGSDSNQEFPKLKFLRVIK